MRETTSRTARILLAAVFAALAVLGAGAPAAASPALAGAAPAATAAAQPSCGDTSSYTQDALSSLPPEATDTVNLIEQDGPYPYPEDGDVFGNREDLLPDCDSGYYHEYTVQTPGSDDRGTRRIVTGDGGEYFYTDDHYDSFDIVDVNRLRGHGLPQWSS